MDANRLKSAVQEITMPDAMQQRILKKLKDTVNVPSSATSRPAFFRKRFFAAGLAALLCLTLAMPVLAANVSPIYELMYQISPSIAQVFQPVQRSCVDNGIQMTVESASLKGATAELYVSLQDLQSDRVDATTDFFDSYTLHTPFDSMSHCSMVGYDAQTKTATFLITITQLNGNAIDGGKITFSAKEFLSQKSTQEGLFIPIDWANIPTFADTHLVSVLGGSTMETTFHAMVPNAARKDFPVPGIDWTGLAWVDGQLHLQIAIPDYARNNNHGFFYLMDAAGNRMDNPATYYFQEEASGIPTTYIEYVFSLPSEELSTYTLYGDFYTSGLLTEGNWKVTFSLKDIP